MPEQMTEEQMKEMQEKVKNMSPEELREFQKKQCIFCHIIEGKVQSKKIFEDEKTIAVLDINPANPGHILLLPKEHYSIMPQLPPEELQHIFMVAKSLSNTALKSLEATGTNIIVANGPAAGQKAQHFMVHIIPRKEGDDLKFNLPQRKIGEKEIDVIHKKLAEKMEKISGVKLQQSQQEVPQLPPQEETPQAPTPSQAPQTPSPIQTQPIQSPKKEVVEAEFTDQPKPQSKEPEDSAETKPKKEPKPKPKKKPRKEKKAEEKHDDDDDDGGNEQPNDSGINLDSIAGVLGIK